MDTNYIIETKNLTKQYGSQKSVADLNIHVKRGRIYGLLGRNGAGKTTTMKMLLGLTKPTSGEVKIWGKSLQGNEKKLLPRIGSLIESPGFYPNLTGTENLRIFATLRGVPNNHAIKDALDLVGLPYKDKKLFSQYSLGMKQRLAIALAVMHDPELLILDEPINGLDPIGIAEVRSFIRELCDARGKADFDICLIGCGAYGFPLAAHVKKIGKQAVHFGGGLQLMFGIKGIRWKNPQIALDVGLPEDCYLKYFSNPAWVSPDAYRTVHSDKVENNCYW